MSGTAGLSPLALQMLGVGSAQPGASAPQGGGNVPLASLQAQNPTIPWYQVPGLVPPSPPPPPLATPPVAAPSTSPMVGANLPDLVTQLAGNPQYAGLSPTNLTNLIYSTPTLQAQLAPQFGGQQPGAPMLTPQAPQFNGTG